jgi:hypothetical protein
MFQSLFDSVRVGAYLPLCGHRSMFQSLFDSVRVGALLCAVFSVFYRALFTLCHLC